MNTYLWLWHLKDCCRNFITQSNGQLIGQHHHVSYLFHNDTAQNVTVNKFSLLQKSVITFTKPQTINIFSVYTMYHIKMAL